MIFFLIWCLLCICWKESTEQLEFCITKWLHLGWTANNNTIYGDYDWSIWKAQIEL